MPDSIGSRTTLTWSACLEGRPWPSGLEWLRSLTRSAQPGLTAGKGIIATEATQEVITTGDVVHVSAGEKHWHGATPDSAFSHIALTAKGSRTTQVEE